MMKKVKSWEKVVLGVIVTLVGVWAFCYFVLWGPIEGEEQAAKYIVLHTTEEVPIEVVESRLYYDELSSKIWDFIQEANLPLEVGQIELVDKVTEQNLHEIVKQFVEGTVFLVQPTGVGKTPTLVRANMARPEDVENYKRVLQEYFIVPESKIFRVIWYARGLPSFSTFGVVDASGRVTYEPILYFNVVRVSRWEGMVRVRDSWENIFGTVLEWIVEVKVSSPDGRTIPVKATDNNPAPNTTVRFVKKAPFFEGCSLAKESYFPYRGRTLFGPIDIEGVTSRVIVAGAGGIARKFKVDKKGFSIEVEEIVGIDLPPQEYSLKLLADGTKIE